MTIAFLAGGLAIAVAIMAITVAVTEDWQFHAARLRGRRAARRIRTRRRNQSPRLDNQPGHRLRIVSGRSGDHAP